MPLERHVVDRLDMTLFTKEAVYGAGVSPWDASSACQMTDFDDASGHVVWDDVVQGNTDVITGKEFPTHQEIVRYSSTINYTEPRTRPNTVSGLLGLAMGGKPVSTRESTALLSYRHALTLGLATQLPSIGVQSAFDSSPLPARYYGVKCSTLTLSNNGPYWQLATTLMGSGARVNAAPAAGITTPVEPWMRWGDTRVFLRPLVSGRTVVPPGPAQATNNLVGGTPFVVSGVSSAIELSPFLRAFSCTINNNFAAESGYRAGSGLYRRHLHAARREITAELTFDVESTQEVAALSSYVSQFNIGLEINCTSTQRCDTNSNLRFGFVLIFPALRITNVARGQEDQIDTVTWTTMAFDDGFNAPLSAWTYNRIYRYLG